MAMASKCDRCNILFEPKLAYNGYKNVYHDLVIRKVNYKTVFEYEKNIELCPKCYESLIAWVEDEKLKEQK